MAKLLHDLSLAHAALAQVREFIQDTVSVGRSSDCQMILGQL